MWAIQSGLYSVSTYFTFTAPKNRHIVTRRNILWAQCSSKEYSLSPIFTQTTKCYNTTCLKIHQHQCADQRRVLCNDWTSDNNICRMVLYPKKWLHISDHILDHKQVMGKKNQDSQGSNKQEAWQSSTKVPDVGFSMMISDDKAAENSNSYSTASTNISACKI